MGVLAWGALSTAGVSALVTANRMAYDLLRGAGAAYLVHLGLRALLARGHRHGSAVAAGRPLGTPPGVRRAAVRAVVNGLANPKLAVFFVAVLPQFLSPGTPVLPAALAMGGVIVGFDVVIYGAVAVLVDRFRRVVRPRLLRALERATGAVLLAFGVRLATEAR